MIGFRVDANEILATGHLMRCISIAEQVKKCGEECLFLLAEEKCTEILQERDFRYVVLNSLWNDLDSEIDDVIVQIKVNRINWLVIDSYQASVNYCNVIEKYAKVMVIDAREDVIYNVSSILNYSHLNDDCHLIELYRDNNIKLLTGLKYAPLREEFSYENKETQRGNSILVTTGGTDPFGIAFSITKKIISDKRFDNYNVIVVLGAMCKDRIKIEELDKERICVYQNIKNMHEIMRKCKVAYTAGGSTSIELCATKTSTVCFSFADNQIPFSRKLSDNGVIDYIGDIRDNEEEFYHQSLEKIYLYLLDDDYYLSKINKMSSVCDGKGSKRIALFLTQ